MRSPQSASAWCSRSRWRTGVVGKAELTWLSRDQGEIGYRIHEMFRSKGYATGVSRKLLTLGFDHLNVNQIIARCDPDNEPSQRLLERLGMTKVKQSDLHMYVMLASEYRKRT